jgi:hypothetical protein
MTAFRNLKHILLADGISPPWLSSLDGRMERNKNRLLSSLLEKGALFKKIGGNFPYVYCIRISERERCKVIYGELLPNI